MSPTSYRTAPPRSSIVTTAARRVKLSGCLLFQARRVDRAGDARPPCQQPFSMSVVNQSPAKSLRQRVLPALLHLGFALTGVGTVLLGCILPRLSAQWHLRDKDAGLLLLVQFAASASGALLVRHDFWKTLAVGYALFGAGGVGIFVLQQRSLFAFGVYGLGLGLAMTSTNLLTSRHYPKRRGAALALLNFSWSTGAVACPVLAAQFLRHAGGGAAFGTVGVLALPLALLPLLADDVALDATAEAEARPTGIRELTTIAYFALLAFLYVGVEASVGNWMTTYATRSAAWSFAGSTVAVAVFWAALLLGRALTPAVLTRVSERRLSRVSVVVTLIGLSLLLAAHSAQMILAGAALTGLALGPVFPLILSLFLTEIGGSRNVGWVFAIAGLGGAVLSWLTGMISTSTGSLRVGLLAPGGAAVMMLLMISRRRAIRRQPFAPGSG
jgi:FHS family glucose/mannose:H+ symporter-like MFS transporter